MYGVSEFGDDSKWAKLAIEGQKTLEEFAEKYGETLPEPGPPQPHPPTQQPFLQDEQTHNIVTAYNQQTTIQRQTVIVQTPTGSHPPLLPPRDKYRQQWTTLEIESEYAPRVGETINGTKFAPVPNARILAMCLPCARGKSTAFHNYMDDILQRIPSARILLMSANILYGTNLASELLRKYAHSPNVRVGFYKEESDLSGFNVVVCSLESIHRVMGQAFYALLIDEVRTIARSIGGATMKSFNNIYCMTSIAMNTPEIVACDADMLFTSDASEGDVTLVHDLFAEICPNRSVLLGKITHPGPEHLKRYAKLIYDACDQDGRNEGKLAFFQQLHRAAKKWHRDKTKRFAICVGTVGQLQDVYKYLTDLKVVVKPYFRDTNEQYKLVDLQDIATAWADVGAVVSTTTLSIGVDPKTTEFDRVFIWTHPMGCLPLATLQGAMRYGRQKAYPLGDRVVVVLIKAQPDAAIEVLNAVAPPMDESSSSSSSSCDDAYQRACKLVCKRRSVANRQTAREINSIGGVPIGVARQTEVSNQIVRIMAHSVVELTMRMCQHDYHVRRCINHYGWTILPDSFQFPSDSEADRTFDIGSIPNIVEDDDDHFAAALTAVDKWEKIVEEITTRGEDGLFESMCYGLIQPKGEKPIRKTSKDQYLVKAFWLLTNIKRLPYQPVDAHGLSQAQQLELLDKPGVLDGLCLNAHMRCTNAEAALRSDALQRINPEKSVAHPLLKPTNGMRMYTMARIAELMEIDRLYDDCMLSQWIVDIAKRETLRMSTETDNLVLRDLKQLIAEMSDQKTGTDMISMLKEVARCCGMHLNGTELEQKEYVRHPNARAKCGRVRIVKFLELQRILPDIVDDWGIYSKHLGYKVATSEWTAAHQYIDVEEGELKIERDMRRDRIQFEPQQGTLHARTIRIDGRKATDATNELLQKKEYSGESFNEYDKQWLTWLYAVDTAAEPMDADGWRALTTTYLIVSKPFHFCSDSTSVQILSPC